MDNFIIYNTEDGQASVKLYANDGTVWLTPTQMAELFDCTRPNVAAHIRSIYSEGELDKAATCKKYLQVQTEGNRSIKRNIIFYSLDMILAVGFRVKIRKDLTLQYWRNTVDQLLSDHGIPVLDHHGQHSHEDMKAIAHEMYEKFAARRRHAEAVQADIDDMAELEKELPYIKGRKK